MKQLKAPLLLIATLAFAIAPFFATSFRGYDGNAFPVPTIDPPIQPAGWAFSIWGLIYLALIAHAAFGLIARRTDPAWDGVRWPLILSLGLGASWLEVAQRAPVLATLQIIVMLLTALWALWRAPYRRDRFLLLFPLAIYAGWLTAATGVSLGVVIIGYGIASPLLASAAMLTLIAAVAMAMQLALDRAPEYALTVIWALIGITIANLGASMLLPAMAVTGIALLGLAIIRVSA
jgi:hypothetical protein